MSDQRTAKCIAGQTDLVFFFISIDYNGREGMVPSSQIQSSIGLHTNSSLEKRYHFQHLKIVGDLKALIF